MEPKGATLYVRSKWGEPFFLLLDRLARATICVCKGRTAVCICVCMACDLNFATKTGLSIGGSYQRTQQNYIWQGLSSRG